MIIEPTASGQTVTGAIRQASHLTGADFQYLLATARIESGLNPNARAQTSSARGLFQFVEQTWLTMLKEQGPALGYGPYAEAIVRQPSGQYAVADPEMRGPIMKLRADPNASAVMAGAYTKSNAGKLSSRLGRAPTEGELYIAHFMGPYGAGRLIEAAQSQPRRSAAAIFPAAARANSSIFYDSHGRPRSVGDVYRSLAGRYQVARAAQDPQPAPANPGRKPEREIPLPRPAPVVVASVAEPSVQAPAPTRVHQVESPPKPLHGLFRTPEGPEAVAPLVTALWTDTAGPEKPTGRSGHRLTRAETSQNQSTAPAAGSAQNGPGLFQEHAPDVRALFRGPA